MGAASRRKGRAFEADVVRWLQRRWPSARLNPIGTEGADVCDVPWSIECKSQKASALPSWWRQCCQQADVDGRPPVLIVKTAGKASVDDAVAYVWASDAIDRLGIPVPSTMSSPVALPAWLWLELA